MPYNGYLKPWLPDILRLWDQGRTPSEIAAHVAVDMRVNPNKLKAYGRAPWPASWGIPDPSSTMVRYVLERTRPAEAKSTRHPTSVGSYPTEHYWRTFGLSPTLAMAQARWERLRTVHAMRSLGLPTAQIAQRFGVTTARVSQLLHRPPNQTSPFEHYLAESDLPRLARSKRLRLWAIKNHTTDLRMWIETRTYV